MLFWTIVGSLAAVLALVVGIARCTGGTSAASSPPAIAPSVPITTAPASPVATSSAAASGPTLAYLADMTPSGDLGMFVTPGLVQIHGKTYPKSITFMCGTTPSDTPGTYSLNGTATRFKATIGVQDNWPTSYLIGGSIMGDGHTLRKFSVSVLKPETINVNVTGVQLLQLECDYAMDTSDGVTYTAQIAWGDANVTERG